MGHKALKCICVALYPIDHKAAITGSQRTGPVRIYPFKTPDIIEPLHDVLVGYSSPVAYDCIRELLAHPWRSMRIYHQHCEIGGGEQLGVPAVRPGGQERRFRATVD